jgi:hypothetical protein
MTANIDIMQKSSQFGPVDNTNEPLKYTRVKL